MNIVQQAALDQKRFKILLAKEIEGEKIPWNKNLKEWHVWAIAALPYFSCAKVGYPQAKFIKLTQSDDKGIDPDIVAFLVNNLQARSAYELGCENDLSKFAAVLIMNDNIAQMWKTFIKPYEEKVTMRMKLQSGTPQLVISH